MLNRWGVHANQLFRALKPSVFNLHRDPSQYLFPFESVIKIMLYLEKKKKKGQKIKVAHWLNKISLLSRSLHLPRRKSIE